MPDCKALTTYDAILKFEFDQAYSYYEDKVIEDAFNLYFLENEVQILMRDSLLLGTLTGVYRANGVETLDSVVNRFFRELVSVQAIVAEDTTKYLLPELIKKALGEAIYVRQ